ncbi:helix-turn-helix transcriptional regulator [Maridesulfovibrio bastinii]|uniref:helix-turn-helix transcriptional regulator n=1 Tax=Maridesulfovibrio bastinii TaxID=47157 RepID=UPI000415C2F0|nr:helix-turn-helix transcriptional regulator [Maridesulfovibrio bastinii]
MLEHTKKSTIEKLGDVVITGQKQDLPEIANIVRQLLKLTKVNAEVKIINDDGEQVFTADEVLPEPTPAGMLRGARFREDMTQADLAKELGIHKNNISEMERGVRKISVDMAKRLGATLNMEYKLFL